MAIYIVQSKTGRTFRRTGTQFPGDAWLAIDTADYEDSAAAILAEPMLANFEITDTDDPDLLSDKVVLNAEIIPAP